MAVLPKHTDQNPRYDPDDDLTLDQLHRFTRAANKAQKKREVIEQSDAPSVIEVARRARRSAVRGEKQGRANNKVSSKRYAVWMVCIAIVALCVMYLSP